MFSPENLRLITEVARRLLASERLQSLPPKQEISPEEQELIRQERAKIKAAMKEGSFVKKELERRGVSTAVGREMG